MKTCIFIDTSNFIHSIKDLFSRDQLIDPNHFLPPNANWKKFFQWLSKKADGNDFLRAYFYHASEYKIYPEETSLASLPLFWDAFKKGYKDKEVVAKMKKNLPNNQPLINAHFKGPRFKLLRDCFRQAKESYKSRKDNAENVQRMKHAVCLKHERLEFAKGGTCRFDLINNEFKQEKGVDVNLAVDMIKLSAIYDVCILISGDQDFVPVVQFLKDTGKLVYVVSFTKKSNTAVKSLSPILARTCDKTIECPYEQVKKFLFPKKC